MSEGNVAREMSLLEYLEQLPNSHRAVREFRRFYAMIEACFNCEKPISDANCHYCRSELRRRIERAEAKGREEGG